MANIPVEKKSGAPWLWWLLGIVLLGGIIWAFAEAFEADEPDMAISTEPAEVTQPADPYGEEAYTGPITDLETLLDTDNPQSLVGRQVSLTGVTASTVGGDSTYWVYNPDAGVQQRVFTVLHTLRESEDGPGTGADGRYNIDAGEDMAVQGKVMAVGADDPNAWGVTGDEARDLREYQVYIRATSLDNVENAGR